MTQLTTAHRRKQKKKLSFAFKAELSLFYEWICIISHCARWIFSNLHSPARHKNHFCMRNTWKNIHRSDCTQMEFLSEMTWASLLPLSRESRKWNLWNFSITLSIFPIFPPNEFPICFRFPGGVNESCKPSVNQTIPDRLISAGRPQNRRCFN